MPRVSSCYSECSHPSADASTNKFVHLALQKTLSLALEKRGPAELGLALGAGLDITIVGDNDFYSQQDQASYLSLDSACTSD